MCGRFMLRSVPVLLIALSASESMKGQEPGASAVPKPSASKSGTSPATPTEAVDRLVEQLKRHPVRPEPAPDLFAIFLINVARGEATLIANKPGPGLNYCGSPAWSHDGRRILFDATPGTQWSLTRLESIEVGQGRPTVTDLGSGNCPSFSPADDRIAFLSNADGVQTGVWMMKPDGTDRKLLGDYGIPKWSPEGRQMMIVSFGENRQVTLMDTNPEMSGVLNFPDFRIFSIPSWADRGTIVAVIGATEGDQVALIDVSDPPRPRVKEVLWRRANGPDIKPSHPIYSAVTRLCVFAGQAKGTSLYSVQQGQGGPAKPLGKEENHLIVNLAFSPDGRYVLYSADGPR
jgi:dipeptidyl aminopeptidase/acylaminoacyl peptidase